MTIPTAIFRISGRGGFRFSWFPVSSLDPRFFWTVRLHAKALIGLLQIRAFFESGPISQIAPQHFECALLWTVASLCHSSTDPCDFITRCGWHGHPYIASAGYLYGPYGFKLCPSNSLCNWLMCSNHTFTTVSQFWIHTPLGFFWNSSVSNAMVSGWFPVAGGGKCTGWPQTEASMVLDHNSSSRRVPCPDLATAPWPSLRWGDDLNPTIHTILWLGLVYSMANSGT